MVDKLLQVSGSPIVQLERRLARAVLWLRPDGWQARARRNAWGAMVADSRRRQERLQAARELHLVSPPAPALRARVR